MKNIIDHTETEVKVKLDAHVVDLIKQHDVKSQNICQYYLDLNDVGVIKFVKNAFDADVDIESFKECRVRKIDGKYILTLKSSGLVGRREMETLLDSFDFVKSNLKVLNSINKIRHTFKFGKYDIEIDEYPNSDLVVAEIEYDSKVNSRAEIVELLKNYFGKYFIADVTKNPKYKNVNLASIDDEEFKNL